MQYCLRRGISFREETHVDRSRLRRHGVPELPISAGDASGLRRSAGLSGIGQVRVQLDMAKQLDDWRRKQDGLAGRPGAIRRLVNALEATSKKRQQEIIRRHRERLHPGDPRHRGYVKFPDH